MWFLRCFCHNSRKVIFWNANLLANTVCCLFWLHLTMVSSDSINHDHDDMSTISTSSTLSSTTTNFLTALVPIPCLLMFLIDQLELKEAIIIIIIIITLSILSMYLISKSTMMTMIIKLIPYFLSLPLSHLLLLFASLTIYHQFRYLWFLLRYQFMIKTKKKRDPPFTLVNFQPQ